MKTPTPDTFHTFTAEDVPTTITQDWLIAAGFKSKDEALRYSVCRKLALARNAHRDAANIPAKRAYTPRLAADKSSPEALRTALAALDATASAYRAALAPSRKV